MPLTKEDLDAIKGVVKETATNVVNEAIAREVKPLAEKVATLSVQPKSDDPDVLANEATKLVQTQIDSLEKQKKDNALELARSQAMATLSVETNLTKPAIKKMLENVPIEAISFKVDALKARYGKKDVKLGDDDTVAAFGEAAALSKEFEAAGGEKELGVSESQYIAMFAGKITEGLGD